MFENGKWYVAYAYHRFASPSDIRSDSTPHDTYEEAIETANYLACGDDDVIIYYRNNNEWYRWWRGKELVTEKEWWRRFPNPSEKED